MGVETRFSRCAQSLSTPFSLQQLNFREQRELIRKACELRSEFWGMQQNNKTQSGLGGEKDDLLNPKIGHKAAQAATTHLLWHIAISVCASNGGVKKRKSNALRNYYNNLNNVRSLHILPHFSLCSSALDLRYKLRQTYYSWKINFTINFSRFFSASLRSRRSHTVRHAEKKGMRRKKKFNSQNFFFFLIFCAMKLPPPPPDAEGKFLWVSLFFARVCLVFEACFSQTCKQKNKSSSSSVARAEGKLRGGQHESRVLRPMRSWEKKVDRSSHGEADIAEQ